MLRSYPPPRASRPPQRNDRRRVIFDENTLVVVGALTQAMNEQMPVRIYEPGSGIEDTPRLVVCRWDQRRFG